ncbi:dipeptidyl-peptidase-4 [Arcticibacter pallidicorallinus]|uniref:Dipeptidyl-peptidase-4 n=1 Tax=Arcticibacter pallidicorallinus TaxID=1259464 RepID=A0A2T0TYW9_9SPHI|nr:S9 family peptidase [Arcticibacter pallidicorallinus]PRY50843.1 dipeptidyl-peptidase-4 [Arcticibacter pallidicorallinus]
MKKLLLLLLISGNVFAQTSQNITLEDIFKKNIFAQRSVYGLNSMKDGKSFASIQRDPQTGKIFVAKSNFSDGTLNKALYFQDNLIYNGDTLELSTDFSGDEKKALIAQDEEPIYRHSTKANYYVYELESKKIIKVSSKGKQSFASFSPDGSKIAFVRDNNLFVKDLENDLREIQITNDGSFNRIINGQSDWVYEEEFAFAKAFFWSPDGQNIAYYKFDESLVPEYSMTVFDKLYPTEYKYKYPKAGEKNSVVSIHVYSLAQQTTVKVDIGAETDQYIPRIRWTNSSSVLCVLRMNRHQNKLEYLLADAASGKSRVILTETDKYYIDIEKEQLTFLQNGKQFINVSERDGFNHIYLYDLNGKVVKQITKGNWEVTELYGVDEQTQTVFFQSAESSPSQRDIFSIKLNGTGKKRLNDQAGTNNATFSADFSYFILNHSTANQPAYITLNDRSGKTVRLLEDNATLKTRLAGFKTTPTEFFSFKTSTGVSLNGWMIKPANFDPQKKYPVLMFVYGGPGSQSVADAWGGTRNKWYNMLAQQGYIVACVDNRGTGFRGAEFKKMTYKNLGKYETEDQIEAAKWLGRQSFVDPGRIGMFGWSYGGYMSSLCITKGADVFKMAIAVAPVTNWRFYDTIYTERYLQTPQENAAGYDDNSPVNFAHLLKGKFLLIHGTGDDNVHFQNSVVLSEALIQANKPFEQAYYPDKNHGIYGGETSMHLYSKMTDFIIDNL